MKYKEELKNYEFHSIYIGNVFEKIKIIFLKNFFKCNLYIATNRLGL